MLTDKPYKMLDGQDDPLFQSEDKNKDMNGLLDGFGSSSGKGGLFDSIPDSPPKTEAVVHNPVSKLSPVANNGQPAALAPADILAQDLNTVDIGNDVYKKLGMTHSHDIDGHLGNTDDNLTEEEEEEEIHKRNHPIYHSEPTSSNNASKPEVPTAKYIRKTDALIISVTDAININDTIGSHKEYLVEARQKPRGPVVSSKRRRYNHFVWLHNKLIVNNPALVIPPPPSTILTLIGGDKTILREMMLELFMNQVSQHPVLSKDPSLDNFLTGSSAAFDHLQNIGPVNSMKPSGGARKIPDVELVAAHRRSQELSQHICSIVIQDTNVLNNLHKRIMLEDQLHEDFNNFAEYSPKLAKHLQLMAQAFHKEEACVDVYTQEYLDYLVYLKNLHRYLSSVQRTILYRDDLQILSESLVESITRKGFEKQATEYGQVGLSLSKLYKTDDQIRREKIHKYTVELEGLERTKKEVDYLLETQSKTVHDELAKWEGLKEDLTKMAIKKLVKANVNYYTDSVNNWQNILNELESLQ